MENQETQGASTVTITVPANMAFGSKVAGEWVPVDIAKADNSYLVELLRYGVQRKVNDGAKGDSPQQKLEVARLLVGEMTSGKPMPIRAVRVSSVAPLVREARKLADVAIKEALAAAGMDVKGMYTGLKAGEKVAKQDAWLADRPEMVESAKQILEAREAAKEAAKDSGPDVAALAKMFG